MLMVWRMSVGDSVGEVAEMVGYSKKWTREIQRRYESEGVEGLGDRRHSNPGAKERALLDEEGQAQLRRALLEGSPPGGGMWSGAKVARWIEQRNGLEKVHLQRGFEYLRKVGHSPQVPRPSNAEGLRVELWDEDEARLGLKPVTRRVWAPVGQRPIARFNRGYKWTYLYGFVCPQSGEVFWLILPTVNVELFSMSLRKFAKEVGAGEDKQVLLVLDQAGWHTGREVELPKGIHLEFLPKGSPELQPAERLWPLTNEEVANRLFEEIEEALVKRCVELLAQRETITDLTNYHWWPQAA